MRFYDLALTTTNSPLVYKLYGLALTLDYACQPFYSLSKRTNGRFMPVLHSAPLICKTNRTEDRIQLAIKLGTDMRCFLSSMNKTSYRFVQVETVI
jgi:hypothetical protein